MGSSRESGGVKLDGWIAQTRFPCYFLFYQETDQGDC
jgi:hypothetical protein